MNIVISKKLMLLTVSLLISLAGGGYFLLLKPVNEQLASKKTELKMAQQQLSILENKANNSNNDVVLSTMELQKQVPVKRLLEQVLLDLEKAEIVSDANIIEIKLEGTESEEEMTELITEDGTINSDLIGESKSENVNENSTIMPSGMNQTSITLSGEADTYYELEEFIDSIQSLKRIITIDSLNFTGRTEVTNVVNELEPIKFELSIETYFYPKLEDLVDDLPPLESPRISNKQNPISGN